MTTVLPATDYTHQLTPLFMPSGVLLSQLLEFVDDCNQKEAHHAQGWGVEELVFPQESFNTAFNLLLNYKPIKKALDSGVLHYELTEIEDGDDIDSITLKAPYLDLEQKIVFYDLPQPRQAMAA